MQHGLGLTHVGERCSRPKCMAVQVGEGPEVDQRGFLITTLGVDSGLKFLKHFLKRIFYFKNIGCLKK